MKTQKEIVMETAIYYGTDPINRRGIVLNEQGQTLACAYCTEDNKKCAVGRYIIPEWTDKSRSWRAPVTNIPIEALNDILIPEVQRHDVEFWDKLQAFHDNRWKHSTENVYFDKTDITDKGYRYLTTVFSLTPEDIDLIKTTIDSNRKSALNPDLNTDEQKG